jgi:hypothetical protein
MTEEELIKSLVEDFPAISVQVSTDDASMVIVNGHIINATDWDRIWPQVLAKLWK